MLQQFASIIAHTSVVTIGTAGERSTLIGRVHVQQTRVFAVPLRADGVGFRRIEDLNSPHTNGTRFDG
jgi:hypothetical protein